MSDEKPTCSVCGSTEVCFATWNIEQVETDGEWAAFQHRGGPTYGCKDHEPPPSLTFWLNGKIDVYPNKTEQLALAYSRTTPTLEIKRLMQKKRDFINLQDDPGLYR